MKEYGIKLDYMVTDCRKPIYQPVNLAEEFLDTLTDKVKGLKLNAWDVATQEVV